MRRGALSRTDGSVAMTPLRRAQRQNVLTADTRRARVLRELPASLCAASQLRRSLRVRSDHEATSAPVRWRRRDARSTE